MLSDEELTEIFRYRFRLIDSRMTPNQQAFCRAIESAACAERDARIAELERQLAEARKDADRYRRLRAGSNWPAVFASHDAPEPLRGEDLDEAIKEQT